jgi:methylthioribose-1-phosphate isomerase
VEEIRAVDWTHGDDDAGPGMVLIDQTLLPGEERRVVCVTVDEVVDAISRLVVRGAPALGAAGAFGVAVAVAQGQRSGWSSETVRAQVQRVREARPTAVNLAWGVDRAVTRLEQGLDAVVAEGRALMADDLAANRTLSRHGADWILRRITETAGAGAEPRVRVLTHCNAGALATTGWGTALGVVRELHERGVLGRVYADETRPLLQGARLTAWELARLGVDHVVQVDAAAASTILGGHVDVAVVGADRIAANGDAANKIGTLGVALACADAGIPFIVAAPLSTVDPRTASGRDIHIELRDGAEVVRWAGTATAPAATEGFNPAFDVTPARLISAIVTEAGVVEPGDGTETIYPPLEHP